MTIFSLLFSLFLAPPQVLAQTATPTLTVQQLLLTPSPSATSSATASEIQKIRQAVQQKVQEKLTAITQSQSTKKGWIGTIVNTTVSTITIEFQGAQKTINYYPDTTFVNDKRKTITADTLKAGQSILAMGQLTSDGNLDAKRVVITDLTPLTKKDIVIAQIADISQSSPIMVLIPLTNKDIQYQVKTNTKTRVVDRSNTKLKMSNLTAGQKVIAILEQDPKNPKSYTALQLLTTDIKPAASPTPTKTSR